MNKSRIATLVILAATLGLPIARAENPPPPPTPPQAPSGPDQAFRQQQQAEFKAHWEAQKKENEAFRATLKDKKPEERKALVEAYVAKQQAENKAFFTKQHEETIAHINASNLPAEKKAELIKNLQARWAEMESKHAARVAEHKAEMEKKHAEHKATHENGKKGPGNGVPQ